MRPANAEAAWPRPKRAQLSLEDNSSDLYLKLRLHAATRGEEEKESGREGYEKVPARKEKEEEEEEE